MYVRRLLPFEIRSTFNPGVHRHAVEIPIYRSTSNRTEQTEHRRANAHAHTDKATRKARILPGTPGILSSAMAMHEHRRSSSKHGERTKERSSSLSSSLIGTLRAPCIPACVPRARPQPTCADLSHITSSTHLARWRCHDGETPSSGARPAYRDYPRDDVSRQSSAKLALARVSFPSIPLPMEFRVFASLTRRISPR